MSSRAAVSSSEQRDGCVSRPKPFVRGACWSYDGGAKDECEKADEQYIDERIGYAVERAPWPLPAEAHLLVRILKARG